MWALNTSVNEVTSYSPYHLMLGRNPRSHFELSAQLNDANVTEFNPATYLGNLAGEMNSIWEKVKKSAQESIKRQAHYHNLRRRQQILKVGEVVWKKEYSQSSTVDQTTRCFDAKWKGPRR